MNKIPFKQFGPMIDCSRNGVLNLQSIKKMIDICAQIGYTTFLLYIEDTYEIPGEPYFGYARGRYTVEEMKEIDAYGLSKGIEVIPCIQTLAHLSIFRWPVYQKVHDCNDILLADSEETYQLIDKMLDTMSRCFTTRTINVGMDEAHMVGRGKYYDAHGDTEKTALLVRHVRKVAQLAEKYGYTISMWSDMFFRIASKGDYYNPKVTVSEELKAMIPDNVELVYWDYYHDKRSFYDAMIIAHEKIKKGTYFAGVLGTCRGLTPCNAQKMAMTKPGIQSCLKNGIEKVMLTSWGDDGGENSRFAALPSLFYAAQLAQGITTMGKIKENFKKQFGISFDAFMLLDLVDGNEYTTDSKNLLYNDVFIGLLDVTIQEGRGQKYAQVARKLARYTKNEEWGYLFRTAHALCRVIELKAEIGKKLRAAYQAGDKEAVQSYIPQLREIVKRIHQFHKAYKTQWMLENKSIGFEIQDLRIGGLIKRVETCTEMLEDYLGGKISEIWELEQTLLDPQEPGAEGNPRPLIENYKFIVSANDIYTTIY